MESRVKEMIFSQAAIVVGGLMFAYVLFNTLGRFSELKFLSFLVVTVILTPRMNLTVPRSMVVLNFSDTMIFLSFLLFGGYEAVIVGAIEVLVSCIYIKRNGTNIQNLRIVVNTAIAIISTGATCLLMSFLTRLYSFDGFATGASQLISLLGVLSILQFLASSILVALYVSALRNTSFSAQWKESGISISVTHIAGAALAGIAYKLLSLGDYLSIAVTLIIFVIAYYNYKKIIGDMASSIEEAETAQKEKSEAERLRAEQAELHAFELGESLQRQKEVSAALEKSRNAFEHAAMHDALTQLPNRLQLHDALSKELAKYADRPRSFYLFYMDMNRFKRINDSLGQTIGDKVLMLAAKRLQRAVRPQDFIARLVSDEFAVILRGETTQEEAAHYASRIFNSLSQPFSVQGNKIFTKPYLGITANDAEYQKPEDMLRDADIAMRHTKEKDIEYTFFDKELRAEFLEMVKLESELRFAVERKELVMFYQPLISLRDGTLTGFEALLRWLHPKFGYIPPDKFIPIAEDSGQIVNITDWILEETTQQLAQWQKISPDYKSLIMSINISGKHLSHDGLVEQVKACAKKAKLKSKTLKLEITETIAMADPERTTDILNKLKKAGVQLSIDDFGTGYSSLSYLHRLPFDTLKIDRSFVSSVGENGENSEILQTVVTLAHNLKMKVIAEGIETEAQMNLLRNLGCEFGQGYLFSKPLPHEEIEPLLYQRQVWFPEKRTASVSRNSRTQPSLPAHISH